MSDVNLSISKEVVTPIVTAKIQEAVLTALGGKEDLINMVVDHIINQRVNSEGKVDSYSYNNKHSWLDIVVTKQIQTLAEQAIKEQLIEASTEIKESIVRHLKTKKGADLAARALLDGLNGAFSSAWRSKVEVKLVLMNSED